MANVLLTTKDNPFNPFTQWDEWYAYDEGMDYHTCSYLARVAFSSDELSSTDELEALETAARSIIQYDPLDIYKLVEADSPVDVSTTSSDKK